MEPDLGGQKHAGVGVVVRALIAGVLIALFSAGAVTAAVLLEVKDTIDKVFPPSAPPPIPGFVPPTPEEAGDPRTFLLLGSDERYGDDELDIKPRSDTMLLVHADPDRKVVTVTSVPRDLRMPVPGFAPRTGKINEAYETKGANGTVKALEALFESAGAHLEIDHVLNVDFRGFRRAVNYVGGVYVDVDHRYFNDNMPPRDSPLPYATIDVKPGYQRLKGQDALDYVRYRHGDSDFLRAARQQDFLRQIKSQPAVRKLLRVQDRDKLGDVFGRYIQADRSFRSTQTLIGLLKLALYMDGSTVQTVRFQGTANEDGSYVDASPGQLTDTLDRLLNPKKRAARVSRGGGGSSRRVDYLQGLERATKPRAPRMTLPFFAPSRQAPGSRLVDDEARRYSLKTMKGRRHDAYRMVFSTGTAGEYWGVQGTSWRTPPILLHPDRVRMVRGRRLLTFSDNGKLRLVGWRTESGAYWISNTLTKALSNREMLGIASTLREIRH